MMWPRRRSERLRGRAEPLTTLRVKEVRPVTMIDRARDGVQRPDRSHEEVAADLAAAIGVLAPHVRAVVDGARRLTPLVWEADALNVEAWDRAIDLEDPATASMSACDLGIRLLLALVDDLNAVLGEPRDGVLHDPQMTPAVIAEAEALISLPDVATVRRAARDAHCGALHAARRPGDGAEGVCRYLTDVLDAGGVMLDPEARRFLRWMSGWDYDTTGQFVGLLTLVARARS
jgi:hypothetical protein